MSDTNRPPLWREIDCAWWSLVDTANPHAAPPENDQAACVIRAVAKWLLPEEEPLPDSVHGGNRAARQAERQRLRALLAAEADRAEQGEVQHG